MLLNSMALYSQRLGGSDGRQQPAPPARWKRMTMEVGVVEVVQPTVAAERLSPRRILCRGLALWSLCVVADGAEVGTGRTASPREERPEMLVVMQEGASPDEIAAVCQRRQDAGFAATLYDSEPAVIVVAGERGRRGR